MIPPGIFEQYDLKAHVVGDDYLEECQRAHGVRLSSGRQHFGASFLAPEGHKALEFKPTDDLRSRHLADFLDEFELDFQRGSLVSHLQGPHPWTDPIPGGFAPLYLDAYDSPLVGLTDPCAPPHVTNWVIEWLLLIDIEDPERRVEALKYLCYRTAPKLWPDIYADWFRPRRVIALTQQRDQAIADRKALERRLQEQIDEELAFYAPYANLLHIGDDALKDLVRRVFQEVFGFTVRDLDAELDAGEPRRLDLLVNFGSESAFMEVRGSGNRNAKVDPDIERLDNNFDLSRQRFGHAALKGLVFNGLYRRDAEERDKNPTFSADVVREATSRGITLLSTRALLQLIERFRNGELTRENVAGLLSRPGLVRPPP